MCVTLLICSSAFSDALSDQFKEFDKETHLQICGTNDTNVLTSGPIYDRFKAVKDQLGYTTPTYLVKNSAFNACASSSEAFIFSGLAEKVDNNQLALVIAHEITHIKNNDIWNLARTKMAMYGEVERAAAAVNKPGYEENAQLVLRAGPTVVNILSLRYSREMEENADTGGIRDVIDKKFDAEKALGLFDQMPSGPSGIFAMLSDHPNSQKRKVYTAEVIAKNVPRGTIEDAIKRIVYQCEPPEFAKAAEKDYGGFSNASAGKYLVLLVKNGENTIKAEQRGSKRKRETLVTLSPEVKNVIFLLTNTRPDCLLRFGMLNFGTNSSVPEFWAPFPILPLKYITMTIPVGALLINDAVEVGMLFGTKPLVTGPNGKIIPDRENVKWQGVTLRFTLAE